MGIILAACHRLKQWHSGGGGAFAHSQPSHHVCGTRQVFVLLIIVSPFVPNRYLQVQIVN